MFAFFTKGELTPHPCEKEGCSFLALYDDEPYCVYHSNDCKNRGIEGYSFVNRSIS